MPTFPRPVGQRVLREGRWMEDTDVVVGVADDPRATDGAGGLQVPGDAFQRTDALDPVVYGGARHARGPVRARPPRRRVDANVALRAE